MAKSNRRSFLAKAPALAVATVGASAAAVAAQDKAAAKAPAAPAAAAPEKPVKKVLWSGGKAPEKQALFSPAVSYGNLLFISGIGAQFDGDIKATPTTC